MKTMTFRSTTKSRGCEEFGPTSLVYTDEVCDDGTVRWSVVGTCDDVYTNESGVRNVGAPLDLETVRAARLRSGWVVVA